METVAKNKLYEGMFLIDSALTGADWDGIIATIRAILEKAGAEIVSITKWDDRRLAYDIKRTSRGTYILSYFRVDGGKIQDIEKSVRLSEKIMRVLILSGEQLSQEDIEKETPASKLEKEKQESPEGAHETPAEPASPPEAVKETEKAEEAEQTEEGTHIPAETSEDLQVADVSPLVDVSPVAEDVSPVAEDVIEKQPEQDEIEGSEQAEEKEQL
ncbi:MAG: 30S ribosomal protein S6 [Planctomycetes bacterium]|nr:30S ribosomal protein S6 [Planctomycetota bacterium]MBL7143281.1 30S ribosomal protein S6 [Phycisphaerae bacterium]